MEQIIAGIDIGGTKCAVSLGRIGSDGGVVIVGKETIPTDAQRPDQVLAVLSELLPELEERHGVKPAAIGISCGGPLDTKNGLILSPPNLAGWDRVSIVSYFQERWNVPVRLQNDANACALAEWRWGSGMESENMIFLTFGTGIGAGLILNGKLYEGSSGMAGEIGHVRLLEQGPAGYGKEGSVEGFCSGGGIGRLGKQMAEEWNRNGRKTSIQTMDAKGIADAAVCGDRLALDIYRMVGKQLGRSLAIVLDLLNPDCIVIGSIYARQESLLKNEMWKEIKKEALPQCSAVCRIVPAGLGEQIGDFGALAVAGTALD